MHQSRAYALLIDTPDAEAAHAAAFWSAALGGTARPVPAEPQFTGAGQYVAVRALARAAARA